ncbi:hypothetical protein FRC08_000661 [Ceratobasidium sp. 394]|nr:hypothetical protein FRC08_000661 [Ceratobasidium sp. 394]
MATTQSLPCEISLNKDGDLVSVASLTPLKATFGVPERATVQTVKGEMLYADPEALNGTYKYAILTKNGKTAVTIGNAAENVKKGVVATADGANGEAAHNGEGSWFVFQT